MMYRLRLFLLLCISLLISEYLLSQTQTCPVNINYNMKSLTHWAAFTGSFQSQNSRTPIATTVYDSLITSTPNTVNAVTIPEYNLSVDGIQVLTTQSSDPFGGFQSIPNINGYQYNYSIQLGSTAIQSSPGGFVRGISYAINVPPGLPTEPYTITYAYAMVLEGAPHLTSQVPLFSATLNTSTGTVACANAFYQLPTFPSGSTYIVDINAATAKGFSLSTTPSPNNNGNGNENRYRVWTKGWTEVTFDLAPYRGQTVSLIFEADNCVPRGHFAYAYIALRDVCSGLSISGNNPACINSIINYSVPALANASYHWTVPPGWIIQPPSDTTNILSVKVSSLTGMDSVTVNEQNSCANLFAAFPVTTSPPTIAGSVIGDTAVCSNINSILLQVTGNTGNILKWLSSSNGINWNDIGNYNSSSFNAVNVSQTTYYKTIVQNGSSCSADTSGGATIIANPVTVAGTISPQNLVVCLGQNKGAVLTLNGSVGKISSWQYSTDTTHWQNVVPTVTDTFYNVISSAKPQQYRAIVQNSAACPSDTSNIAYAAIYNATFPQASISPEDTTICFGTRVPLHVTINTATNYSWQNQNSLYDPNNYYVGSSPYSFSALAAPSSQTNYVIAFKNGSCPNLLLDTFRVNVYPTIYVNAGNDTSIVAGQPLQLNAVSSDTTNVSYLWTPIIGMNNPSIYNPITTLGAEIDSITYFVRATSISGCYGTAKKKITIYKSAPEIFVPSAFTPNGDGRNDILIPIPVGIVSLDYFRIYNRWGQMLFSTSELNKGWDGNANGNPQQSGTYVYMAQGTDYLGNKIFRKGTVVLIR